MKVAFCLLLLVACASGAFLRRDVAPKAAAKPPSAASVKATKSLEASLTKASVEQEKKSTTTITREVKQSMKQTFTAKMTIKDNVVSKEAPVPKEDGFVAKGGKFDYAKLASSLSRKSLQMQMLTQVLEILSAKMRFNVEEAPKNIEATKKMRAEKKAAAEKAGKTTVQQSTFTAEISSVIAKFTQMQAELQVLQTTQVAVVTAVKTQSAEYKTAFTSITTELKTYWAEAHKFHTSCEVEKIGGFQSKFKAAWAKVQTEIDTCVKELPAPPPLPDFPAFPPGIGASFEELTVTKQTTDSTMDWLTSEKTITSSTETAVTFTPEDPKGVKVDSQASLTSKVQKFKEVEPAFDEQRLAARLDAEEAQLEQAKSFAQRLMREGPRGEAAEEAVARFKAIKAEAPAAKDKKMGDTVKSGAGVSDGEYESSKAVDGKTVGVSGIANTGSAGDKQFQKVITNIGQENVWISQLQDWAKTLTDKQVDDATLKTEVKRMALTGDIESAIALLDKRLTWFRDAAKIATHYMMWAMAEQRRGLSVTTTTKKEGVEMTSIVAQLVKQTQSFETTKAEVMVSMMKAYTYTSAMAQQIIDLQKTIQATFAQGTQRLQSAKSAYESLVKSLKNIEKEKADLIAKATKLKCKEIAALTKSVEAAAATAKDVTKLKCYEAFEVRRRRERRGDERRGRGTGDGGRGEGGEFLLV